MFYAFFVFRRFILSTKTINVTTRHPDATMKNTFSINLPLKILYNYYNMKVSYFISSPEYLDSKRDEIVGLCEMFNARAYINLNKKSYKQVSLKALEILAGKIAHEEYDIRSLFESACGQTGACDGQKTWIVDFDSKDLDELDRIKNIIDSIDPKGVSKIVETVPTRHGYHLITRPFNKKAFYEMYNNSIDIHDNNPTCLYINLKDDENE